MGMQTDKVRFNVGGKIFDTTATTLANACRSSVFGAMFDDQWNLQPREVNDEYFIDRDPECFSVLLNLLRTCDLHLPPNIPEKLFYREALYYGLLDNVRTAKLGPLNGNKLKLTCSVKFPAPYVCTAIRASPDGGCAVAHGSIVHVYNWMLEERDPIIFDYRKVNDIGWIDSENILVSAGQISGQEDGAIGLFSSSTGDLRHRYEVKQRTSGALCFNSDGKIFACCGGKDYNNGIGVWDQVTGKQIDFFNATSGSFSLGDADKIQWLNGSNCLFASYITRTNHKKHISLLDFRNKSRVWDWSNQNQNHGYHKPVYDAIAVEESNSICVVSDHDDLGFIDMKSTSRTIRWNPGNYTDVRYPYYPKLTSHGRHVFYSVNNYNQCSSLRNGSIFVFSGPDYSVLTSTLGTSCDSSVRIRDISISGDRLFVLHEVNTFDVWETPSPSII